MMPHDPAEQNGLREDLAHTRAELGETMEALAAKADVKARANQMTDEAKARVRETTRDAATKAGSVTYGAATKAGSATRGIGSKATRAAQTMMRRPMAWVLVLAGIGVVSAVKARRRRR